MDTKIDAEFGISNASRKKSVAINYLRRHKNPYK
jgi:hypothetical protein